MTNESLEQRVLDLNRLVRVGDLPAKIQNPQDWPAGYADGFNDYARHVEDFALQSTPVPQGDASLLHALVEDWRRHAAQQDRAHRRQHGYEIDFSHQARSDTLDTCADELEAVLSARAAPVEGEDLHSATADLMNRFSAAMRAKLAAAERKYGYSDGWLQPDWMDECRQKLAEHVAKGDPRDVAAYCAFLWHHGERTATTAPVVGDAALHDLVEELASDAGAEWDKAQDRQWSEWVRDRHHGRSDGLADAARRIMALLDTARPAKAEGDA